MQKFTEEDYEIGFAICECGKNVHTLQAGFDAKRVICDTCKSSVISIDEWNRADDGAEILAK